MKRWTLIIGTIVTVTIILTAAGGYLWFKQTLKKRLPQTSGEITVQGLRHDVEIIRDTYGVPHVYAKDEPDLYFGFGFAAAQDRFWQMEFYRRVGQGRLSEIFGKDFVDLDRYVRTLSAAGVNSEVPEELAFIFESYAKGVNAYLEIHRDNLPIEFTLLGYTPEPWLGDDYLSILKVASWGLSFGWSVDLTAARILEKVGEQKLREAFPVWPDDAPLFIPDETRSLAGLSDSAVQVAHSARKLVGFFGLAGSNNWVISGKRSVTGKPILANDPHLELTHPSLLWEVHLVCPTFDVSGAGFPGEPGISLGHNRHVAWGLTNVMLDDVDFYIERINPNNPRQYRVKDHWENMEVIEETIRVKGEEPVKTEILLTRHGPVIDWLETDSGRMAISARWAFMELPQPVRAHYFLAKATNARDVVEAVRSWTLPGQNVVFADTSGNIGYFCGAAIPIRSKGDGLLPMPGWTDEYEWKGYVPFEARPQTINPEAGFIATANNKIVERDYPYVISHYWEPEDRIERIRQMLTSKEKLSVEDFMRMQQDVYSESASELVPRMIQVLEERLNGAIAQRAKRILAKWDFMMVRSSVGACLFEVTYRRLIENTFKDELGEELFEKYLGTGVFPARAMRRALRRVSSPWFDNVDTPEPEVLEDVLAESLEEALTELEDLIGKDMDKWTWGRIHSLTFKHPLGRKKPLTWIFNAGPFPVGGTNLTVNMGAYPYEKPYQMDAGASLRMIVDLSNMQASLRVLSTGESGHLGSRHYGDQTALYLEGRYHPDWTDRSEVEEHTEAVLILRPAS